MGTAKERRAGGEMSFGGDRRGNRGTHPTNEMPNEVRILRNVFRCFRITPPPCASTATVPEVRSKRGFNAHPVLRQGRACA